MNPAEVLRRLYKEKKEWQRTDDRTPEVEWTLRGIDLCLKHVQDIIKEQRTNFRLKHPKVDHQHATKLYRACYGAWKALRRSQRLHAIKILQHVMDLVPPGTHGRPL